MIALHRINQPDHEFFLNPDLILAIEANPDTVITLTNGSKYVVAETPGEVARLVQEWRSGILAGALVDARRRQPSAHAARPSGSCSSFPAPAPRREHQSVLAQ